MNDGQRLAAVTAAFMGMFTVLSLTIAAAAMGDMIALRLMVVCAVASYATQFLDALMLHVDPNRWMLVPVGMACWGIAGLTGGAAAFLMVF